jgi:hypothetical protein
MATGRKRLFNVTPFVVLFDRVMNQSTIRFVSWRV